MSAIANRYKRGELVGIGFEADFGGCRCHCIAWENAQVERLRDDPVFTEGLIIDAIDLSVATQYGDSPVFKMALRIAELESQLAALTNMDSEELKLFLKGFELGNDDETPETGEGTIDLSGAVDVVDNPEPIVTSPAYLNGSYLGEIVAMSSPKVIATHEPIEPTTTETPVEQIQEPVAGVSELTASPPAQAPDTPAEASWAPTPGDSEAATIRSYLKQFGDLPSKSVIEALAEFGVVVTSSQVLVAKKALKQ